MSESEPSRTPGFWLRLYDALTLSRGGALVIVAATLALTLFLARRIKDFEMDASSDSITLRRDDDLRYYDQSRFDFGADEFAVVVVQTDTIDRLISDEYLDLIGRLQKKLEAVPSVDTTLSILDAPLFHSPDIPLMMARNFNTLRSPKTDRELAKKELLESPLFNDYILAKDDQGVATAIMINFDPDWDYLKLERDYQALKLELAAKKSPTAEEKTRLEEMREKWESQHVQYTRGRQKGIKDIRAVMAEFERENPAVGKLVESGVAMVIADMVSFIGRDIKWFMAAALMMLIVTLTVVFRNLKWVAVPLITCAIVVAILYGYLGLTHWRTTMVSSNTGSLLLILSMSMAIHIAARYRELHSERPDLSNRELVLNSVRQMIEPCSYMIVTTLVGFGSLYFSGITPVMDFGKMMTLGLVLSFAVCFIFMPAVLALLPKGAKPPLKLSDPSNRSWLSRVAEMLERRPKTNLFLSGAMLVVCLFGIGRLSVEARFLDYFSENSKINTSMTLIDKRLGGTMNLEVVLEGDSDDYWLKPENMKKLQTAHAYIDGLDQTGKVVSLATVNQILERVNKGKPLAPAMIKTAVNSLPENMKQQILKPYATQDFRKARIWIRVRESDKNLRRTELRQTIATFLTNDMGLKLGGNAHITGYFVLYNNMINTLFKSQIMTLGWDLLIIWLMFLFIFRSLKLASIMLVPNLFPISLILGMMGWLGIHLDMMTVMIASVTLGIAVDDTVHYTHRFRHEFERIGNYVETMRFCHNSIARAMSYSSITVVLGFMILSLSEFVPTVYFGLFTGLAMVIAFYGDIVLMPILFLKLKPFGPERTNAGAEAPLEAVGDSIG